MIREFNELLNIDYGNWKQEEKNFACPKIEEMFVGESPENISNDYHHNRDAGSSKFSNGIKFTHYYACMNHQLKQNGIEIENATQQTCSMDDMVEAMKYMTIVEKAKDLMNTEMSGGSGVGVDESFKKTLDHFKNYFLGIEVQMETDEPDETDEPEESDEDVLLDLVSNALIQIGNVNDQSETNPVTLYAKGVNTYKNANKCVQDYINSVMNAITTKVISESEFAILTNTTSETYDSFKVKISGYIETTLSKLDNAHVMVTHYIEKNKDTINLVNTKLMEYASHIRNYVVREFKKNYTKEGVTQQEKDELDEIRKKEIKNIQTLLDKTKGDTDFANKVTEATAELSAAITLLDNANKNLDAEKAKLALQKEHTQAKRADLIKQKRYPAANKGTKTPAITGTEMETEPEPEPAANTETEPAANAATTGTEPVTETLGGGKKRRTKKQTRKTKRSKKQARKTKKSNKKNKTTKKRSTKNR